MIIERTARIRALNDQLRRHEIAGDVLLTPAIAAFGKGFTVSALTAVASFSAFEPGNDPYGEHDFGLVIVQGQRLFWKIDYYNHSLTQAAEDPSDHASTRRVLTLMLPEEY